MGNTATKHLVAVASTRFIGLFARTTGGEFQNNTQYDGHKDANNHGNEDILPRLQILRTANRCSHTSGDTA